MLRNTKREHPFVSIVVVVLNMENRIYRCLSSLERLDYPRDRYEIVVVDGGSTDRTLEICKEFNVKCVVENRKGRGLARNVGIKHSTGEIIAFIDADCEASKDWLSIHVANHSADFIGAVGGAVVNPHLGISSKPAVLAHYENFVEFDETLPRRFTYHIPTCNGSFKRKIFSSVGCFNEELDMYEDFLLSQKIANAGYKILFDPSAKVLHYGIRPTMTVDSYLRKEQKMGEAHFRAQKVNKHIFGRLPMNRTVVLLFAHCIVFARTTRELYKLMHVSDFSRRAFAFLPYLGMGGLAWSLAYVRAAILS